MREPAFWYRRATWTSHLLSPLAALYGAIAARRLLGKGFDAGIPVLCVGSYHLGGAGKTPTVLALVKILRELGETPVVLSRGYGGRLRGPAIVDRSRHNATDVGDEPTMMAAHVPVVIARDRIDGVALAKSRRASVILMDDGFQNPSIAKDCSLIVIDSERGLGNGLVFPAGPLRAPLDVQLARTDALVTVGEDEASNAVAAAVAARGAAVFSARLIAEASSLARLKGKQLLAFAGIGDPGRFFRTLRKNGLEVARECAFADHHRYSERDLESLLELSSRDVLTLVTTEKDLARLTGAAQPPDFARTVVPFAITLQFDDVPAVRRFLSDVLVRAREKKFCKA